MQVTIARQLGLEPTTVGNFFMNARRRSMDKWKDEDPKTVAVEEGQLSPTIAELDKELQTKFLNANSHGTYPSTVINVNLQTQVKEFKVLRIASRWRMVIGKGLVFALYSTTIRFDEALDILADDHCDSQRINEDVISKDIIYSQNIDSQSIEINYLGNYQKQIVFN
ncbi:Homeobox protein onecut [Melipona quadrifasciata]|uniref:Homeobox protein onecut n=1 Tax=Melipona quadrifasciata TaxID=166423 RepID=A0A0M8ZY28_9HYME|nr:Homeobox protein onecut [Melipona quadrifasciata]